MLSSGGGKGRGKRWRGKFHGGQLRYCVCVDGAFGRACEHVCDNDCFNACSGHGSCVHGWCKCDPGWFGTDCADTLGLRYQRSDLPKDVFQFGHGAVSAQVEELPPELQEHANRLKGKVYMYDVPANVNRHSEVWMWKQWGTAEDHGKCDPVYNRRIYAAQSHFDAHLMHDDFARTLEPSEAVLFYVPVFLNQRVTWGADLRAPRTPMLSALEYVKHAHPWWNASGGRNHVWFVFGERQTCLVPPEIAARSIVVGHWGDEACVSKDKDVVVPTITPIQHDLPRFHERLQRAMRAASAQSWERTGPLLLFAGGIMSFGASQARPPPRARTSSPRHTSECPSFGPRVLCRLRHASPRRGSPHHQGDMAEVARAYPAPAARSHVRLHRRSRASPCAGQHPQVGQRHRRQAPQVAAVRLSPGAPCLACGCRRAPFLPLPPNASHPPCCPGPGAWSVTRARGPT